MPKRKGVGTQHTLTVADCPDNTTLRNNIIDWYTHATATQVLDGSDWYERALEWCTIAAIKYGYSVDVVAAVVAVISPNTKWHINLIMAESLLMGLRERYDGKAFSGYGNNHQKARDIIRTGEVTPYVKGPKVIRFYQAILGYDTWPVIDSWAVRAATNDMSLNGPGACYDAIAKAYTDVADYIKMNVHDLQAIVWAVVRESAS